MMDKVFRGMAIQNTQVPSVQHSPTGAVLGVYTALAAIPARYVIERGAWAEARALEVRPTFPAADAITHFTRAMAFARNGDVNGARKEIAHLWSLEDALRQSRDDYWKEQVEIQRTAAEAWVAHVEDKKEEALRLMRYAADLEDGSGKHVAMENWLWPMRELLGELLLEMDEPAEALKEFETSFKASPNRFRGFYGAAKTAERLGDLERAKTYYGKLMDLCGKADTDRPELIEARGFLARIR